MRKCSMCGNLESADRKIIEGKNANICKSCWEICGEAFEDLYIEENNTTKFNILKPHEIKAKLDEYIIGQEEAKRVLSVAVYNHYKRINYKSKVNIQKTNIMLVGPTGSGKTYIMQTLAEILNVPIVIVDANSFTEAGYVGDDVETILLKLYKKAQGDIELAEKGIVYIDEVDKIVSKTSGNYRVVDANGTGVQQALLKIIENSEVTFYAKGDGLNKREITMNTKNILFVAGGAFVGLEEVIAKRTKKHNGIGFATSFTDNKDKETQDTNIILQEDIINYGFIPEFVGRIPVIVKLDKLMKEELKEILIKPKNAIIKQYKELFKLDGINIKFNNDAIEYIVNEAEKKNIGARGLKGIIEKQIYNLMYELPIYSNIKKFTITEKILKSSKEEIENYIQEAISNEEEKKEVSNNS